MPFIGVCEKIPADTIRKRLGKPNQFGWITFGWSEFGDNNPYSGVYQQRHNRKWNGAGGFIMTSGPKNFFMKPAWPVYVETWDRNVQIEKFKYSLIMWQALTEAEKMSYNRIASRKSKRGYDYFMSKTLKSLG